MKRNVPPSFKKHRVGSKNDSRVSRWASAIVVTVAVVAAHACSAGGPSVETPGDGPGDGGGNGDDDGMGGTSSGGSAGSAGTISTGGGSGSSGSSGSAGDGSSGGGPCVPIDCTAEGGKYCGTISDGCGSSIDCGACSGEWTCENNVCVGGPSCTPSTACSSGSSTFCGAIGDGCGRSVECPSCAEGLECRNRVCVEPNCVPATSCKAADGVTVYCGTIGDGCGGTLTCDECPDGYTCGGGGLEGICGAPDCPTRVECNDAEGRQQYCGRIGSGCGGALDCPATCGNGATCGMETPNVCPSTGT